MMLALFNKKQKKVIEGIKAEEPIELNSDIVSDRPVAGPTQDEDSMKKSIADKLRKYRPVEREANFTGPKFYR